MVTATLEQWQRIIITFVAHGQQTKRQKLLSDPLECLIIKDPRPGVQQVGRLTSWCAVLCGLGSGCLMWAEMSDLPSNQLQADLGVLTCKVPQEEVQRVHYQQQTAGDSSKTAPSTKLGSKALIGARGLSRACSRCLQLLHMG